MTDPALADVLDRALAAEAALEVLGSDVEDDWQYVTDLAGAWRLRLEAVRSTRGGEPAPPVVVTAVAALIEETALITDPHRAIDWLSTLPQVVLAALGERT